VEQKLQIDYQAKAAQSQSAGEIEETSVEPNFLPKDLLETAKVHMRTQISYVPIVLHSGMRLGK
jgi:hypothetical protein